jgi:hypothetical protein
MIHELIYIQNIQRQLNIEGIIYYIWIREYLSHIAILVGISSKFCYS